MSIFRGDEDRFELRALQLELEQRHRLENGGFHREFWTSRYEQMQLFLIDRYRKMSKSYKCEEISNGQGQRARFADQAS